MILSVPGGLERIVLERAAAKAEIKSFSLTTVGFKYMLKLGSVLAGAAA